MISKKLMEKTSDLIVNLYQIYPSGGNLHIVLDDENLEDNNIEYCLKRIISKREHYGYGRKEWRRLEKTIAKNLLKMSLEERDQCLCMASKKIYENSLKSDE